MVFPWLRSTALLLLWICCTAVDAQNGCGPPPRRDREELADLSPKESYAHDEIVLYNCRPGYIKLGRFRMQCKNGNWEQAPPYIECKKKPCGHPGDMQFGSFELVEGEGFFFGARVVYHCDEGYQMLSRADFRICRADGWSNEVPHCEITKCFPVREPENGRIIQTGIMDLDQDFMFGHLLRFECDEHFKIEGSEQIVCTGLGTWSAPVPKCVEVTCQPELVPHGRIVAPRKLYKDGDRIQLACDRGYKYADRNEATCTRNGWSARLECVDIVCLPPYVENGDIKSKAAQYGFEDTVEMECDAGFQSSAPTSMCTDKGWQPPAMCIPKSCGYVRIQNGEFYRNELPSRFPKRLGYETYYSCDSGFLPPNKGSWQKITCTKTGWEPEPKCFKICDHRKTFRNGQFTYGYWTSPFIEGDTIPYSCDGGYHPVNKNARVTCTRDGWLPTPRCGTWEESLPSCANTAPPNGFFVDRTAHFTLYEKVTYRCQSGFTTPEGHDTGETQCLADGWRPEPKCVKTCLKPTVENAIFDTTKTTFYSKETLHYECKEGYETVKKTTRGHTECTENGWEPSPICLAIECEALSLENGRVDDRQDKYVNRDVVRFSCSKGFTRVGPDSAQCYHFGWSPQPPVCKAQVMPCQEPAANIPHGILDGELAEQYQHGDKVAYECNIGFAMTGSNTIECIDGEWTALPSCTEESETCGQPQNILSGQLVPHDTHIYKHNETVDYECTGKLAGRITARCLHGEWELPSCLGKCKRPKNIKFITGVPLQNEFNNNEIANYTCHAGVSTTKCVDGKWSPEPDCKEFCPPPPQLPNAANTAERRNYRSGEEVSFTCMEHFVLQGPQKIMCEGTRWQTPPRCIDTRCGKPPSIPNGEAQSDASRTYAPGEKVAYTCQEGFALANQKRAVCKDAEWSQLPRCNENGCGKPPIIDHASYSKRVKSAYKPGETLDYNCHIGFAAEGPQIITCRRGEWSEPSTCEDATCRHPPVVDNAEIKEERAESYMPGQELHYQCQEGFEISGPDAIRCENKAWSTPPRCNDIRCPPPPSIRNGEINGLPKQKYMPSEKVSYRCHRSYSRFGPSAATCLKKEWINVPECRAVGGRCDRPPSIDNGDILEMAKLEYTSGEKVHYKCQNMYTMEGNAEVSCYNGHWSDPPSCIVPCTASEEDMKINNIRLAWRGGTKIYSEAGDTVEFACRSGFVPQPGSPEFRVQCRDGRFEYPRCISRV